MPGAPPCWLPLMQHNPQIPQPDWGYAPPPYPPPPYRQPLMPLIHQCAPMLHPQHGEQPLPQYYQQHHPYQPQPVHGPPPPGQNIQLCIPLNPIPAAPVQSRMQPNTEPHPGDMIVHQLLSRHCTDRHIAYRFQVDVIASDLKCDFLVETDIPWEDFKSCVFSHILIMWQERLNLFIICR